MTRQEVDLALYHKQKQILIDIDIDIGIDIGYRRHLVGRSPNRFKQPELHCFAIIIQVWLLKVNQHGDGSFHGTLSESPLLTILFLYQTGVSSQLREQYHDLINPARSNT